MAKKKSFPLRINEETLNAVKGWAADDLRSINAQLEYIIRDALRKNGRLKNPNNTKPKHQEETDN